MSEQSRSESHGESMTNAAPNPADIAVVHCHDCWKYTDDMRREGDFVHEAAAIVINGGTLAVEKSDAFQAADKFLARKFNAAGFSKDVVAATRVDPWKL